MQMQQFIGNNEIRWPRLVIGMLITLVLSLSIHVVMLQVLGIPFPEFAGVSVWASFLNTTLAVLSVIVGCEFAQERLALFPAGIRYLIVFLLYAMLKESLRGIVMSGVVTSGWGFDVVQGVPSLVYALLLTSLATFITPKLHKTWSKILVSVALAGLLMFAVKPLLHSVFAPAVKAAARFDHADIYPFPYGWQVLVPAYLTYAEPVIACLLLAVLVWRSLSKKPGVRLLQFALLVLLMRGMLLPTFIYSFYSTARLSSAVLSQSQFLFETLALGILTALVWQFSLRSGDEALRTTTANSNLPARLSSEPITAPS